MVLFRRGGIGMNIWGSVILYTIGILILLILLAVLIIGIIIVFKWRTDLHQKQHAILRNFPFLARIRYISESISPQLKQYFFDSDVDGKPYSQADYIAIVKSGKYAKSIIPFGSKRDFDKPGIYIRNAFFPKQKNELNAEHIPNIESKKYIIEKETLISRKEHLQDTTLDPWLYTEEDAIVIGAETCRYPFKLKSPIGMSGMSYGALGEHAITALSYGLKDAHSFMNTGEGGISPHHLKGDVDIICQIGPAKFGFRQADGSFSWPELVKKASLPQIKAFEIKLGQGAKIRGGHIEGEKVSMEIAKVRRVEPFKTIDSPNRFEEFYNYNSMMDFIENIREKSGKPVGIKVVIGSEEEFEEFVQYMAQTGRHPDFISVDGGEGGTGATFKAMADSVGLPILPALIIVQKLLVQYNLRDRITILAGGKLYSADRIIEALSLGADAVQIARGLMIAVGCIRAEKCHTNKCPVGVATTDPKLQKALVIDEKRYRVTNYIVRLREEIFMLAASAGIESPRQFRPEHLTFVDDKLTVNSLMELQREKVRTE